MTTTRIEHDLLGGRDLAALGKSGALPGSEKPCQRPCEKRGGH